MHGSNPPALYGPGAPQISEPLGGDTSRDPLPLPRDSIHIRDSSRDIPINIRDPGLPRDLPPVPREPKEQDSNGESMAQFLKKALRIEGAQLTQKTITIR